MSVWRYKAVALRAGGSAAPKTGELAAGTEAEARAALRRIGLQPIALRPMRSARKAQSDASSSSTGRAGIARAVLATRDRWLCSRRSEQKAELFDALATLVSSGVPLVEAVDTLAGPSNDRVKSVRQMLVAIRERIRSGEALADAMAAEPAWFDAAEVAMARAGQASGELPSVLRMLAVRRQRSSGLSAKLAAALTYPLIVGLVTLGVVLFLSTRTLPQLALLLTDAGVAVPALTKFVVTAGSTITGNWPVLLLGGVVVVVASLGMPVLLRRLGLTRSLRLDRWVPATCRRVVVADALMTLAELVRSGVTLVESLRVIAPTVTGLGASGLRRSFAAAADRVEQGESVAEALTDPHWFDDELRRLITIGETSGELDDILQRIGERYERSARRMIDRLTALLEPAAIVVLALAVGTVVMAAILPLLKLQEIAR